MHEQKTSAGNYDLNKWLFGGYDKDIISMIYGPAGSGKSNFCIIASVSQARKGKKVIFIDTEGGFSIDRFRQIAKENAENALKNIILLKPTSFSEQEQAFVRLLKEIKTNEQIGLIIVDGMTMLYRLELAENKEDINKIKDINSKLARQMRILAEIARKESIPVLITNQTYYEFMNEDDFKAGKERKVGIVGGDISRYWSKCIIELKNDAGRRKAILRKHRSLPEKELVFVGIGAIIEIWDVKEYETSAMSDDEFESLAGELFGEDFNISD